jgi:TetR/AcrR family transcriptional regulator, cholesterol catabolism regulator
LAIDHYFRVVDEMQDEVLVMYQEVKSLSKDALPYVLRKELEMVGMFETLIERCVENKELNLTDQQVKMLAHNIFVQGQMWGFRRWALQKLYTLDEYIVLQTDLLLSGVEGKGQTEKLTESTNKS